MQTAWRRKRQAAGMGPSQGALPMCTPDVHRASKAALAPGGDTTTPAGHQRAGWAQDCSCGHPWAPWERPCGAWTTPGLHLQDASSTRQLGDQVASRHRPGPRVTSQALGSTAFQFPSLQAPAFLRHDPTSLLNRFLLQRPSRSVQTWSVDSRCI